MKYFDDTLPKITIITPVFNSEPLVVSCIGNVAKQTYSNKEHILVDGLSVDNTLQLIKDCSASYSHIKWISEKDNGIYDAMNKGIQLNLGEWIFFLGCDDNFVDDHVLMRLFGRYSDFNYDVIYGNVIFAKTKKLYDGKFNSVKLMERNICHQAIFFRKSVFAKHGCYETKYKYLADWVFNMKWFHDKTLRVKYVPDVIVNYNECGRSSNSYDNEFIADFDMLKRKYFPKYSLLIDKYKYKRIIKGIAKLGFGV